MMADVVLRTALCTGTCPTTELRGCGGGDLSIGRENAAVRKTKGNWRVCNRAGCKHLANSTTRHLLFPFLLGEKKMRI